QIDGVGGEDLWVIGEGEARALLGVEPTPMTRAHGLRTYPTTFVAADLDGDALADLIGCNHQGVIVVYARADATNDPPVRLSSGACTQLSACDLDADGDL